MDLGLKDRVAIVAAASRGIGYACARELAREGARVFLCARKAEQVTEAARKIHTETGANVAGLACDVTDDGAVRAFVELALARAGCVDVCVTNAGGPPARTFAETDLEVFRQAFELNALSAIRFAKLVLPGMLERKWGRIINITSIAAKQPVDNLILSNSIRAAVTGFSRSLATEVAADGVTVNTLLPGYTRTERVEELARMMAEKQGITPAEFIARWEKEIPMGRIGTPREFAALAAFLVSERASYITGTSIPVDGGWIKSLL